WGVWNVGSVNWVALPRVAREYDVAGCHEECALRSVGETQQAAGGALLEFRVEDAGATFNRRHGRSLSVRSGCSALRRAAVGWQWSASGAVDGTGSAGGLRCHFVAQVAGVAQCKQCKKVLGEIR